MRAQDGMTPQVRQVTSALHTSLGILVFERQLRTSHHVYVSAHYFDVGSVASRGNAEWRCRHNFNGPLWAF